MYLLNLMCISFYLHVSREFRKRCQVTWISELAYRREPLNLTVVAQHSRKQAARARVRPVSKRRKTAKQQRTQTHKNPQENKTPQR